MGKPLAAAAALVLAVALCFPAAAVEPELLEIQPFEVRLTDEAGQEKDLFEPRETLYFDIRFVLTMSEVNRYPVTITLVQQIGLETKELELYSGQLQEGFYQLRVPLEELPIRDGEVVAKVIMKTRVSNRTSTRTQSFYSYKRWEGTYRVGYR